MISCVMSIYGFYSTNLVLRRPETSATDKSHFCSFDAHTLCVFVIVLRPPPDRIAFSVRRKSKKKRSI